MKDLKTLSAALVTSVMSIQKSDAEAKDELLNVNFAKFSKAFEEIVTPLVEARAKIQKDGAISFQEALQNTMSAQAIAEAIKPLMDGVTALGQSLTTVLNDPSIQDKQAAIQSTVSQFDEFMDGAVAQLTGAEVDNGEGEEGEEQAGPGETQPGPDAQSQQGGAPAKVDDPKADEQQMQDGEEDPEKKGPPAKKPFGKSADGLQDFSKNHGDSIEIVLGELRKGMAMPGDEVPIVKAFMGSVIAVIEGLHGEAIAKAASNKSALESCQAHLDMAQQHLESVMAPMGPTDVEKDGDMMDPSLMAGDPMGDSMMKNQPDPAALADLIAKAAAEAVAKAVAPLQAEIAKKDEALEEVTKRLAKIEGEPKSGGPVINPTAIAKSEKAAVVFVPRDTDFNGQEAVEMMKGAHAQPQFTPRRD